MSKKKQESNTLKDRLNDELLAKLTTKKQELRKQEEDKLQKEKEKEKQVKIAEQKRKEANKSFEELLSDSEMDWRKFK
ncbi:DUF3886 domain-containing protein [Aquibacillus halophilus]|uniref:DUF3886 domain-containing protein n=1 Tax=Aquibacillus halophilus TaxID=930132 RepID=A0A6A8D978_9BACI|nr:YqkE family protein [Aquibacillus halophilus]MRH42323.1 DUF3886 domain-containing protein [Aquibacillus halophilus]